MTEIEDILEYRSIFLDDCKDDEGFIHQSNILNEVMPLLLESKAVDSETIEDIYYSNEEENLKLNGYAYNSSKERLQLFLIDENLIKVNSDQEELLISQRNEYLSQFKRVERIVKKAFKGNLSNQIQDSDPLKVLSTNLESLEGFKQIDVVEIFLISLSVSTSFRGKTPIPITIKHFHDEEINRTLSLDNEKFEKEVIIQKKLIDLNYIYDVSISRKRRDVLTINFEKTFKCSIETIKAASNENFESYLCVFKANVLVDLYRRHSSQLLEKNVRSFLDFKGVNKGIKETINDDPEKFIAYNNGLTITATNIKTYEKKKKLYIEELTDFQIVNGGQTTASIYFSQKEGFDVSEVMVMAKINVVKNTNDRDLNDLINNISKFSNAQSKVSKVDLKSRDPKLVKIKSLSESVLTPSGKKWFFERSKGELNVIVKKAINRKREKDKYPPKIRFTKEQLGKYYCAWGDIPYLVKKGGERIFRNFLEHLSPDEDSGIEPPIVDKDYYEDLIVKVILFRCMENLYGTRSKAIGQIRAAVIPYSLSILYINTDAKGKIFDMSKIWKNEGLEDSLSDYLYSLMVLMNDLIKKYSLSDDLGEYSKKIELWDSIKDCKEIEMFMSTKNSIKILDKYRK